MGEGPCDEGQEPQRAAGATGRRGPGQESVSVDIRQRSGPGSCEGRKQHFVSLFPSLKVMENTLKGRSEGGFLSRQHLGRKHRGASRGGGDADGPPDPLPLQL